jgi:hypothetical protein
VWRKWGREAFNGTLGNTTKQYLNKNLWYNIRLFWWMGLVIQEYRGTKYFKFWGDCLLENFSIIINEILQF